MVSLTELGEHIDLSTSSAKILVISNVSTIIFAVASGMGPSSIVWAYWLESLIIGLITVITLLLLALRAFPDIRNIGSGLFMAGFFCIHYGGFHAGYFLFLNLLPWFMPDPAYYQDIGIVAGILFISHAYSFVSNVLRNPARLVASEDNMSRYVIEPYRRIIPMHVTIILSGFVMIPAALVMAVLGTATEQALGSAVFIMKTIALLLFMTIKTIGDLVAHRMRYEKDGITYR